MKQTCAMWPSPTSSQTYRSILITGRRLDIPSKSSMGTSDITRTRLNPSSPSPKCTASHRSRFFGTTICWTHALCTAQCSTLYIQHPFKLTNLIGMQKVHFGEAKMLLKIRTTRLILMLCSGSSLSSLQRCCWLSAGALNSDAPVLGGWRPSCLSCAVRATEPKYGRKGKDGGQSEGGGEHNLSTSLECLDQVPVAASLRYFLVM